jgi:CO/xanthine dehydrogenase Mo-binding subunit
VGEGALAGVAAAIATALADAGVLVDELPATPERVWRSLAARKIAAENAPTRNL